MFKRIDLHSVCSAKGTFVFTTTLAFQIYQNYHLQLLPEKSVMVVMIGQTLCLELEKPRIVPKGACEKHESQLRDIIIHLKGLELE